MKKWSCSLLVIVICSVFAPLVTAQVAPVCRVAAADADGDGFGWENQTSCIVTMASEPAPSFTNLVTHEQVNLTRAYWNPITDLYNTEVTCIASRYDSRTGTYVADNDPDRETHYIFQYTHLPLSSTAPFTGSVKSLHIVTAGPRSDFWSRETIVDWSMDNGIYTGGAPFTESPYVELVSGASTAETAIRTWRSDSEYVQCSAVPTGVPPVFGNDSTEADDNDVDGSGGESGSPDSAISERMPDDIDSSGNESNDTDADDDRTTVVSNTNVDSPGATGEDSVQGIVVTIEPVANDDVSDGRLSNPFTTTAGGGTFASWLLLALVLLRVWRRN